MSGNLRVLIAGAGIGGLCLAWISTEANRPNEEIRLLIHLTQEFGVWCYPIWCADNAILHCHLADRRKASLTPIFRETVHKRLWHADFCAIW